MPGVSLFLPLSASLSLFPCVYVHLFRLYLSLCVSVYPNLFLFGVVSLCFCLSLCVRVCRSSLFLVLFVSLCFFCRVFASVYLVVSVHIYLCFYIFICLCLFLRVGL